jgi:hypothetical protein
MKIFLRLTALIAVISSASSSAYAISATANARVVTPVAISQTTALEFGSFASSAAAGTITQAGVVSGGVTAVAGGSTRSAGVFAVSGESSASTTYTFTLPTTATLTSGANTMTATLSFASGTAARTLTTGADTVSINGSLAVGASQAAGVYTGTYTVTVAY